IDAISDRQNDVYLSLVSLWEMQIKSQLGKLQLVSPMQQLISEQRVRNGIQLMPIKPPHIFGLNDLPHHHRDPFDRLLISQALLEDTWLVTHDRQIQQYNLKIMWDKPVE
ncbi:MAG: type II toxin-antitoxin system VapC family toxin, partial [Anaerolineae bacterium]|nr:type II toxin-antitoxin system VapC family toxin [Anaerolineae bacterium]